MHSNSEHVYDRRPAEPAPPAATAHAELGEALLRRYLSAHASPQPQGNAALRELEARVAQLDGGPGATDRDERRWLEQRFAALRASLASDTSDTVRRSIEALSLRLDALLHRLDTIDNATRPVPALERRIASLAAHLDDARSMASTQHAASSAIAGRLDRLSRQVDQSSAALATLVDNAEPLIASVASMSATRTAAELAQLLDARIDGPLAALGTDLRNNTMSMHQTTRRLDTRLDGIEATLRTERALRPAADVQRPRLATPIDPAARAARPGTDATAADHAWTISSLEAALDHEARRRSHAPGADTGRLKPAQMPRNRPLPAEPARRRADRLVTASTLPLIVAVSLLLLAGLGMLYATLSQPVPRSTPRASLDRPVAGVAAKTAGPERGTTPPRARSLYRG